MPTQDCNRQTSQNDHGQPPLRRHRNWFIHRQVIPPAEPSQIARAPTPVNYPTIHQAPRLQDIVHGPTETPGNLSYNETHRLIRFLERPFLPEDDYLGCTLPTSNLSELWQFRDCCVYLLQHHPDYQIDHPLTDIFCICPHPIVFVGFLWRYRIFITNQGILEDYCMVTASTDNSDSVRLRKAFTAFYSWSEYSYTVSIV